MTHDNERAPAGGARSRHGEGATEAGRESALRRLWALRARRLRANQRADAYNRAHPAACAELNRLTDSECGAGEQVDCAAVRAWQRRQQLVSDGRVSGATLAAARARHGDARGEVSFDEADTEPIVVDAAQLPDAARAVAGGATDGLESREADERDTGAQAADAHASHDAASHDAASHDAASHDAGAHDAGAHDAGAHDVSAHGAARDGTDEDAARAGQLREALHHGLTAGGGSVPGVVGRLALAAALLPPLVELLRARRYRDAVRFVVHSVSLEDRMELLHHALEALAAEVGHELPELLVRTLERAALAGAVLDVLALGWEWTAAGLEAIARAHERGDRDSRIAIYAWAWSDTLLGERHDNPGAVTPDEREAMTMGIRDGEATRALQPELGPLLLAQYGSAHEARHALEDALLGRAGIAVRTHGRR